MNNIFTIAYSEEEANEIGHFIMSKGYEGVQNDSYRYCDIKISWCLKKNKEHHRDHIYVGVKGCQMVVAKTKRGLRRNGLRYIEKKRKFYELLSQYQSMKRKDKNNSDSLIDNMVSCLKIQEALDKKLSKRIRLMPEIKKNFDFVAKNETSVESEYFCAGFVEGTEWIINALWHNSSEKPMPGKLLIVNTIYGGYELCYYGAYALWNTVMTWAYVKDLIPTKEGEQ